MFKVSRLPSWFDRNPISIADFYWKELAPHVYATRFSYTVPASRMAMIESLEADIVRSEAAMTAGYATSKFGFRPDGWPNEQDILNAWLETIHNNVGDENRKMLGGIILMCEGDRLRAITGEIGGTDGKVMYLLSVKLTEFDALQPIDREIVVEPSKPDIQEAEEKPWWWPF